MPDLGSQEFVEDRSVSNHVINLLSYHLSLSHFPRTFFPELIGIVAFQVEWHAVTLDDMLSKTNQFGLSAVNQSFQEMGNSYKKMKELLKKAIDKYMDEMCSLHGVKEAQKAASRIWEGVSKTATLTRAIAEEVNGEKNKF